MYFGYYGTMGLCDHGTMGIGTMRADARDYGTIALPYPRGTNSIFISGLIISLIYVWRILVLAIGQY